MARTKKSRVHEDPTIAGAATQSPLSQEANRSPCTQRVNQKLPLVCYINGQTGGSRCREVEWLKGKMMYDLGVGSKQSRFGWGCYPNARRLDTLLHMLQVIHSRRIECERVRIHGTIRRVGQPARQRVRGFQVQRLPGSAFSMVPMLSGRVNYRGTLPSSGASLLDKTVPIGDSKFGAMALVPISGHLS